MKYVVVVAMFVFSVVNHTWTEDATCLVMIHISAVSLIYVIMQTLYNYLRK